MQKLMQERISSVEEKPLSAEDLQLLKAKRKKQFTFLLSGYLPLIAIGVFVLLYGVESINLSAKNKYQRIEITEETTSQFRTVAPYVFLFFFLMATIYFVRYYFQSVRPIVKDIKAGKKNCFFFKSNKSAMPFFNRYYLSTPLYQNQQIETSHEDFDGIAEDNELCLETGPNSTFILRLLNGEKEIKYY